MADDFKDLFREIERERDEAFKAGVARINDSMQLWGPDYVSFYRLAADALFEKMETKPGMLDLIAIPYLQSVRHVVELLMKSLLDSVIHIARYRTELKSEPTFEPSSDMQKAVGEGHDLKHLLEHLKEALKCTGLDAPAESLVTLVDKIASIERHHTAMRYPQHVKRGKVQSSFEKDTRIEVFAIHEAFQACMDEHLSSFGAPQDETVQGRLEHELHDLVHNLMLLEEQETKKEIRNKAGGNTLLRLYRWLTDQGKAQSPEAGTFNACADELKRIFAEELKNSRLESKP